MMVMDYSYQIGLLRIGIRNVDFVSKAVFDDIRRGHCLGVVCVLDDNEGLGKR